ncbi:hypothetical protein G6F65_012531 [Rhizopus arrhizus]|nr:hypothetical protein G6F65_012531 [Rhizopus arrhizus]
MSPGAGRWPSPPPLLCPNPCLPRRGSACGEWSAVLAAAFQRGADELRTQGGGPCVRSKGGGDGQRPAPEDIRTQGPPPCAAQNNPRRNLSARAHRASAGATPGTSARSTSACATCARRAGTPPRCRVRAPHRSSPGCAAAADPAAPPPSRAADPPASAPSAGRSRAWAGTPVARAGSAPTGASESACARHRGTSDAAAGARPGAPPPCPAAAHGSMRKSSSWMRASAGSAVSCCWKIVTGSRAPSTTCAGCRQRVTRCR